MKVKDVMTFALVTVSPKSSYKTIWTTVFAKKINAVPVVDHRKKLLGIITKEDLLKQLYPDFTQFIADFEETNFEDLEEKVKDFVHLTAVDVMNPRVVFTRHETPAMRALSRMISQRVNQLPVLSEDDTVIGMVTKGDVFYALFKKHLRPVRKKRLAVG